MTQPISCRDCRFFLEDGRCFNDKAKSFNEIGDPLWKDAKSMRTYDEWCGYDAKLFEAQPPSRVFPWILGCVIALGVFVALHDVVHLWKW